MPRRSKSIFHVGEQPDGGEATDSAAATATSMASSGGQLLLVIRRAGHRRAYCSDGAVEGLRILIHDIQAENSNVVNKASLKAAGDGRLGGLPDFLKVCCLCKKQLKPCKDVYMYKGDQGFCSRECRSRQISLDERREYLEMAARRRSRAPHHRPSTTRNNIRESDSFTRIQALVAYH